ncbi:General substrate transporter [Niveomyces insectorum RCEF 264]|uniref:General substrate transporter n=1 Tax=Niveomyces insectorum RCEF 264 TaxID=1081102 RepID=A0A167UKE6_9HYPO|nr:General substrate transporter [Niveomyces insectorum RCEF 264]
MISPERNTLLAANWRCLLICLFVSLANCQYGFDTNALAGFQAMAGFLRIFGYADPKSASGYNIHTKPQQLISSFLNVGTIVGAVAAVPFSHRFGRRHAIWAGCGVSFVACAVQLASTTLGGLYAGRILMGVANGFFTTFSNVYTVEAAPPHLRGMIVSFFGLWVNIGSVLGSVCDNYTKNYTTSRIAYQIPLAVLFVLPTLLAVLVVFIPESPRWLLVQDRPEDARAALARLRGGSLPRAFLDEEFVEMQRGIAEERALASSASFLDMFRGTNLRRTVISAGAVVTHAATGLWFILSFGTYFFQAAGLNKPFLASVLGTVTGLGGAIVGLFLTHRLFGRRTMMMVGATGCACCMLAIAVAYTVAAGSLAAGRALLAFAFMFYFFYNGFIGTVSWPIAGEVVASRLRVSTISLGTGFNYFFNWLISYCSPYFINKDDLNWGPKYGYIWAGANFAALVFIIFMVPETKGRSLEEIDELFENRVSVWRFKSYQCISSEAAKEIVKKDHEAGLPEPNVVHIEL